MIRRFFQSRGWGKFRRDRRAMVALGVILLYGLLAVYIATAEGFEKLGRATGWYSLAGTPAGIFLPSETLARVGPEKLGGFGRDQDPELRAVQYGWYVEELGRAIRDTDRLDAASGVTPEDVIARYAVAERRLAPLPLEELRSLHARASSILDRRDSYTIRRSTLRNAVHKAESLRGAANRLRELAAKAADASAESRDSLEDSLNPGELDPELARRLDRAREDVVFLLEELAFDIAEYAGAADPESELALVPLEPLEDAALALADAEGADLPDPLYDRELVDRIVLLAKARADELRDELGGVMDELRPVIEEIYPMPAGAAGLLYRFKTLLGTDRQGRSIMVRSLYSAKVAIQVGFVTAVISVLVGSLLGAAAAFYGGWVDNLVNWLFSVLSSIPHLVLLVVIAFMFTGTGVDGTLIPVYAALCMTFWIGPCRVVRGEALKIKELEYVQAATAIGFSRLYILVRHVLPNTLHLMFISFSLLFIAAIKSEVILTFLGLGLKEGASWGIMISQSKAEVVGRFFWQIGSATFFMFVLVLAFNIVSDALQDAFDPKHVG